MSEPKPSTERAYIRALATRHDAALAEANRTGGNAFQVALDLRDELDALRAQMSEDDAALFQRRYEEEMNALVQASSDVLTKQTVAVAAPESSGAGTAALLSIVGLVAIMGIIVAGVWLALSGGDEGASKKMLIETCMDRIRSGAKYPSTVEFSALGTAVTQRQNGGQRVDLQFSAKNAYSLKIEFEGVCLFDKGSYIIASATARELNSGEAMKSWGGAASTSTTSSSLTQAEIDAAVEATRKQAEAARRYAPARSTAVSYPAPDSEAAKRTGRACISGIVNSSDSGKWQPLRIGGTTMDCTVEQ